MPQSTGGCPSCERDRRLLLCFYWEKIRGTLEDDLGGCAASDRAKRVNADSWVLHSEMVTWQWLLGAGARARWQPIRAARSSDPNHCRF